MGRELVVQVLSGKQKNEGMHLLAHPLAYFRSVALMFFCVQINFSIETFGGTGKILYFCWQRMLNTTMTEVRRNQIIEQIRQTARRVTPASTRILLFGSQARGDAREDSDWDILVLLNKPRIRLEDIDNVSYPLRELGWEIGENINTVLYTVNDWEKDSFTPFHKNVEAEGIPL